MDIRQLKYFINIVEQDFNMSVAAEMLYVSQSTLSVAITKFEKHEKIDLFERIGGRLVGLTAEGEKFFHSAVTVVQLHDDMMEKFRAGSSTVTGNIRIGIPPFVLSVAFAEILPKLITENPHIKFDIKEAGAYQLEKDLILGEIDLAILLAPESISHEIIDSYELYNSELTCFMSPKHAFASKKIISWHDLHHQKMANFDETFMLHHMLKNKLQRYNVSPNFIIHSQSWDFLINSVIINADSLVILPHPIVDIYTFNNLIEKPMHSPIPWRITAARLKKNKYSNLQMHVLDELLASFAGSIPYTKLKKNT